MVSRRPGEPPLGRWLASNRADPPAFQLAFMLVEFYGGLVVACRPKVGTPTTHQMLWVRVRYTRQCIPPAHCFACDALCLPLPQYSGRAVLRTMPARCSGCALTMVWRLPLDGKPPRRSEACNKGMGTLRILTGNTCSHAYIADNRKCNGTTCTRKPSRNI